MKLERGRAKHREIRRGGRTEKFWTQDLRPPYAHKKIPLDGREILNNNLIFLRKKVSQMGDWSVLRSFQWESCLLVRVMTESENLGFWQIWLRFGILAIFQSAALSGPIDF